MINYIIQCNCGEQQHMVYMIKVAPNAVLESRNKSAEALLILSLIFNAFLVFHFVLW